MALSSYKTTDYRTIQSALVKSYEIHAYRYSQLVRQNNHNNNNNKHTQTHSHTHTRFVFPSHIYVRRVPSLLRLSLCLVHISYAYGVRSLGTLSSHTLRLEHELKTNIKRIQHLQLYAKTFNFCEPFLTQTIQNAKYVCAVPSETCLSLSV